MSYKHCSFRVLKFQKETCCFSKETFLGLAFLNINNFATSSYPHGKSSELE